MVLSSLSNNAREVFRCIADAQLDPEGNGGITFQSLFNVCKEKFLASNENILKTFLTEFKDHDILQTKCVVVILFFLNTIFGRLIVVSCDAGDQTRVPVMCFLCPWIMLHLELFFHCAD